ncbi:hypothetical protein HDU77_002667 [Chytriomyces hyalinus]|nr:hypothetical protein HDU77_002667 [Chytriomyces hyalinus]
MSSSGTGIGPMTPQDDNSNDVREPTLTKESRPLAGNTFAQPEGQQVSNNEKSSVSGTATQATGTLFASGTQTGTALASATVFETDGPLFGGIATEVPKTGAIVGSLIGVIAVLGLVAGFLLYRRKYMNQNRRKSDSEREALEVSDQFLPSPATVQLEILASLEATLREYETFVSQKAATVAAHERDLTSNVVPEKTAKFEPSNESDLNSSHSRANMGTESDNDNDDLAIAAAAASVAAVTADVVSWTGFMALAVDEH